MVIFANFRANARVVRHLVLLPVFRTDGLAPDSLGDAAARAVVLHLEFVQFIVRTPLKHCSLLKFDRHTPPIIGNFQIPGLVLDQIAFGIVQKNIAISLGSFVKNTLHTNPIIHHHLNNSYSFGLTR